MMSQICHILTYAILSKRHYSGMPQFPPIKKECGNIYLTEMENSFFFLYCSNLKSEWGTLKYLLKINQRLWEIRFRRQERDVLKSIKPTHRESHQ